MDIFDKEGRIIATSDPPDTRYFDNMTIHSAVLTGLELEGICFVGSDLRGSDFTCADLYGAHLANANFDSCSFAQADLRNSFLHNVSFRNADMRNAKFSLSEMKGRLHLYQVDFTKANLEGADFTGAVYDSLTIFPDGFVPEEHGLMSESAAKAFAIARRIADEGC